MYAYKRTMKTEKTLFIGQLLAATIMLTCAVQTSAFPTSHYPDSSRLADWNWVRVSVERSGIHCISVADLEHAGIRDVSHVHVFGRGGSAISEKLTEDIPNDPPQVPIIRVGNNILFYAQGPTTWAPTDSMTFQHTLHPYSTLGYYLVCEDDSLKDKSAEKSTIAPSGTRVSTFTERLYHEEELVNPGGTGRNMLGEDLMAQPKQHYKFQLPGFVDGSQVSVNTQVGVNVTQGKCNLTYYYNNAKLPSSDLESFSITKDLNYDLYLTYTDIRKRNLSNFGTVKRFKLSGTNELDFGVEMNYTGALNFARFDFVTVNYERRLSMEGLQELQFGSGPNTNTDICYVISNAKEETRVWDVTVPYAPVELQTQFSENELTFSPIAGGHREYIAFNPSGTFTHVGNSLPVSNQDIHSKPTPDMIIVTTSVYRSQARRLAKFHEQNDSMRVLVVMQPEVFNEFSSGTPDAMAIRMMCKMFYDRGTDAAGHRLQYLLMMGDGTYDNRDLISEMRSLNKSKLITWQSIDSYSHEYKSLVSDDPFVILGDNSGPNFNVHPMSIAVGRFPVSNEEEARIMVDKAINYMSSNDYGTWKNQALNVADDMDNGIHMQQAEQVINTMRENGGESLIYNHVFIDAFPETTVGGTRTFPEAKAMMLNRLREGVAWWNYTGHASPNNWGAEGMLRRTDITDNLYYSHLPLLYAATCSFAKFDAATESGAENMVMNPRGGTIASISSTREVLISYNGPLNNAVAKFAFSRDSKGRSMPIGEILRLGKNEVIANKKDTTTNKMCYVLLGDPALRLSQPSNRIVIETINGKAINHQDLPEFRGCQTVTFAGHITDYQGNKLPEFNGTVRSTLYDSEQSVTTHGYSTTSGSGAEFTYLDRTNRLALTVDTIRGGEFSIRITIPSEVLGTYENYSPSLLNMYAYDETNGLEASGSCSDFYIYGYDDTESTDTDGPEIAFLGLNSSAFNDGDAVNESPIVLATISDASGVNFSTAGIGHEITLLLDNKVSYNDLSGYYTPQQTTIGTVGTLQFPLSSLKAGEHSLRLRVWDVHRNMSEKTIHFNVSPGMKPELVDVYATQNPAYSNTTFYVEHDRPEAVVKVTIEVYDLMGRLVWTTTQSGKSNQFMSFPITWNLTSNNGNRVPRGIYVYRATLTSNNGEYESSKAKKIAVGDE